MNVFLIGYRCTGKTTVGKALADRLNWSFADTDEVVVKKTGGSIARMVDIHGWPFFREQEHRALKVVSANDCQVVATGGGIVLDKRNISFMEESGKAVWLRAGEKTIGARMLADTSTEDNRPSLTSQGLLGEITTMLAERTPLYEKTADLVIDTDRITIAAICDRIVAELGIEFG